MTSKSAVIWFAVINAVCADFVEESWQSSSFSAQTSLEIPRLELSGEEFSVCVGEEMTGEVATLTLPRQLPGGVDGLEVFSCSSLATTDPFECNTLEQLSLLCDSPRLQAAQTSDGGAESDIAFPLATSGLVLRASFTAGAVGPSQPITVGVEQSASRSTAKEAGGDVSNLPHIKKDDWRLKWSSPLTSVSGVSANEDTLFVFHRGSAQWAADTFDDGNVFHDLEARIPAETVLKCDPVSGECAPGGLGKDMFLMPHGVSVAGDELLLTDVGSHQVTRMTHTGEVIATLGQFGVPGNDGEHFCKPTKALVHKPTGLLLVADGYCNSRVAIFDQDNQFVGEIDSCGDTPMNVVHSIAFDGQFQRLFVADRENSRICVYSVEESEFGRELGTIPMEDRVFAVETSGDLMFTASVPLGKPAYASVMDEDGFESWSDPSFVMPHDVTVHNKHVYIADVHSPNGVFRFTAE